MESSEKPETEEECFQKNIQVVKSFSIQLLDLQKNLNTETPTYELESKKQVIGGMIPGMQATVEYLEKNPYVQYRKSIQQVESIRQKANQNENIEFRDMMLRMADSSEGLLRLLHQIK